MLATFLKRLGGIFSLNDPEWGRDEKDKNKKPEGAKSEKGPPDLDQVWRDFNQSLSRFFGGKGNGTGGGDKGGNFSPDATSAKIIVGVALLAVGFIWMVSGFFIVKEGQTGLVTTFGKFSHKAPAGFNWRWPTPIQAHEIVDVSQVRTVEVGYRGNVKSKEAKESLMLTDDENIIDIQFTVQYTLTNAVDWLYNNRDQEKMMRQVAETAIREVVGKSKMDFVLYEGSAKMSVDVLKVMQKILNEYNSGVQINNLTIQAVQPPEQVQSAFDDALKAGQDKERQKSEGLAYANDVIPKARGEASRMLEEADAYKSRVVSIAEGNASRFKQVLVEYQKAPAVTRDRMYLETMQQIFSSTTKLMMDAKTNGNMLYVPIDKLISQTEGNQVVRPAQQQSVDQQAAEQVATVEVRAPKDNRVRDSRERESR